jgi:hypothetical protein
MIPASAAKQAAEKSRKAIPRGLKFAWNDKNKGLAAGPAEAEPVQTFDSSHLRATDL